MKEYLEFYYKYTLNILLIFHECLYFYETFYSLFFISFSFRPCKNSNSSLVILKHILYQLGCSSNYLTKWVYSPRRSPSSS